MIGHLMKASQLTSYSNGGMLSQRQHEFNEMYLSFLGNNGENIVLLFYSLRHVPVKKLAFKKRKEKPWNNNKKTSEKQYSLE